MRILGKQLILRGVKISLFLLAVTLVASFMTIQSSRPTQAGGLLYSVTCLVGGLLSYDCKKPTPPSGGTATPPPASQPPTDPTPPSQPAEPPAEPAAPAAGPTTPASGALQIDKTLLTQLPAVPPVSNAQVAGGVSDPPAHVLPNITGDAPFEVLGTADVATLQASEDGWQIFGVAWYWWAISIGGVVGAYFLGRFLMAKSFFGLVK